MCFVLHDGGADDGEAYQEKEKIEEIGATVLLHEDYYLHREQVGPQP